MKEKHIAIVLAAGNGSRMNSSIPKQYLPIHGRPLLFYALKAFQDSFIDEIVLVVTPGNTEYVQKKIVDLYQFNKVKHIVEGGKERYDSVRAGLKAAGECDFVYIHDGARPVIHTDMLNRLCNELKKYPACIAGMPVKDTIKIVDDKQQVIETPNRNKLWSIQTPQCFQIKLLLDAYEQFDLARETNDKKADGITDDAMIIERFSEQKVRIIEGSYDNIKVTTKEDLLFVEKILKFD